VVVKQWNVVKKLSDDVLARIDKLVARNAFTDRPYDPGIGRDVMTGRLKRFHQCRMLQLKKYQQQALNWAQRWIQEVLDTMLAHLVQLRRVLSFDISMVGSICAVKTPGCTVGLHLSFTAGATSSVCLADALLVVCALHGDQTVATTYRLGP